MRQNIPDWNCFIRKTSSGQGPSLVSCGLMYLGPRCWFGIRFTHDAFRGRAVNRIPNRSRAPRTVRELPGSIKWARDAVAQVPRPAARSLGGKPPPDWLLKRLDKSRDGLESRFMRPRQVAPHTIGTRSRWPTLEILALRIEFTDQANQRPPDGEVLEVTHLLRQMNRDCQAA